MDGAIRQRSCRGFTLVEALTAMLLLSILAGLVSSLIFHLGRDSEQNRVALQTQSIELSILAAASDRAVIASLTPSVKVSRFATLYFTDQELQLDLDGRTCTGAKCSVRARAVLKDSPSVAGHKVLEYSVQSVKNFPTVKSVVNAQMPIPKTWFEAANLGSAVVVNPILQNEIRCPEGSLLKGVSAAGEPDCWNLRLEACPEKHFPSGLRFLEVTKSVEYLCSRLPELRCLPLTALSQLNLSQAATGSGAESLCRPSVVGSIPGIWNPQTRAFICPRDLRLDETSSLVFDLNVGNKRCYPSIQSGAGKTPLDSFERAPAIEFAQEGAES